MARYDEHTKDFMAKMGAELPKPKEPETDIADTARSGLATLKGLVVSKNPATVAARLGTAALAGKAFEQPKEEKLAGMGPLKIYAYLNDKYSREWHDWEPETIWQTLDMDEGISISSELKNTVMALQVLVNTNQAHEHWHIFENVVHSFNNNAVDFAVLQPAELDEIAFALKVIKAIRPKEELSLR